MRQVRHELLTFQNPDFAIHQLIENCPDRTVVRELLKNAEENAILLDSPGKIEWFVEIIEGVRKLGLFNEGPGMSEKNLSRLMDMASTGKTLGTDRNFGQGGKVSGLKISPAGLIYRSCSGGKVCEIILAAEQQPAVDYPTYIKRRLLVPEGSWEAVRDVTDRYHGRKDRPLTTDWTEVVLIGRSSDQDTVTCLLPDATRTNWLIREINQRFYRFPKDIVVRNAD